MILGAFYLKEDRMDEINKRVMLQLEKIQHSSKSQPSAARHQAVVKSVTMIINNLILRHIINVKV